MLSRVCALMQTTIMTQDGCYLSPVVSQCRAALHGVLNDGLVPALQLYFTLISGVLSKRAALLNTTLTVRVAAVVGSPSVLRSCDGAVLLSLL